MLDSFTWFMQSAFRWDNGGQVVYIDPWRVGAGAPLADVVFVTHAHFDHFRPDEIAALRRPDTIVVAPADVAGELPGPVKAVAPGDSFDVQGLSVEVLPAYNLSPERGHPKENAWVGYVIEGGGTRWYHAGDTDHVPELDAVQADAAFLPIGGTYTMDPIEAAGLAREIAPGVAVPMHYGFVVGEMGDARRFEEAAAPVAVQILSPRQPWGTGEEDDR